MIIGGGAVGATLAAELHRADKQVVLVARGANPAALRERGLRYVTRWAPTWSRLPVAHRPNEIELYRDDVLMLATKSQETEELVRTRARGPVGGSTAAAQPAGGRAAERPGERAGDPAAPRLSSAPSSEFRRATSNPVRSCPTSDCEAPDPNRVSHPDADSGSTPRPRSQ